MIETVVGTVVVTFAEVLLLWAEASAVATWFALRPLVNQKHHLAEADEKNLLGILASLMV